jgi:N-acetylneuraminic acid mutarotase
MSAKTNRKKCLIIVAAFLCSGGSDAKASFASGTLENVAVAASSLSLGAGDTWTQKADMPTTRLALAASVVNGKIYAIGGRADGALTTEYDPATDTWTTKTRMPTSRFGLATSVVDGKIYAIGGGSGPGSIFGTVEEYDPLTDTWTKKADLPKRNIFFSTSVVDGKIYAIGGAAATPWSTHFQDVYAYDPLTDTWTKKADMPTARAFLSTSVVDGKIYAIGGALASKTMLSTVEVYDPVTDTWTTKTPMPTPRIGHATAVVDGIIYAIGGGTHTPSRRFPVVEAYDLATDTWTTKADIPAPIAYLSTGVVEGKIYAFGGTTTSGLHPPGVRTVYEYDANPLVVDFNGDEIVNFKDFSMLAEYWYRDDSPFVNNMMDYEYLTGFAEYWLEDFRLTAHWTLDETEGTIAHDSVGENDGTLHGEPVWQPVGGEIDGALQFDGIDDYVGAGFPLGPMDLSLSAFAWVKGGAPGQVIISQPDRRVGRFIEPGSTWLGIDPSDGRLMTKLLDPLFGPLESDSVITDGQWHHVGLVYDFDGFHRRLYVDGAEVAKDTDVVAGLLSDSELYFGAGQSLDVASFFSGLIDDVRIYNQALSAEEIEELTR